MSRVMVCEHLRPILDYLLTQGAAVETQYQRTENGWNVVILNDFFYKREIEERFELPSGVTWAYADPHYAEGNSLNCASCLCTLESRFDPRNPKRTLGMEK